MKITTTAPQIRVHFFPSNGRDAAQRVVIDTRIADALVSVVTHKDLRSPAGSFSVTMTPRVPGTTDAWRDRLRIGDLVVIEMGPDRLQPDGWYQQQVRHLQGLEVVMIGSVDSLRERFQMGGDGRPSTLLTVTGRDFGKYFVDDTIWFDSYFHPMSNRYKFLEFLNEWTKARTNNTASPIAVMQAVLAFMFRPEKGKDLGGHDILFDLGQKGPSGVKLFGPTLLSKLLRRTLSCSIQQIPFATSPDSYQGAPWNLLQQYSGVPFYTLLLDTRRKIDCDLLIANGKEPVGEKHPGSIWDTELGNFAAQPALLYYRTPFSCRDYDDWLSLPLRAVFESDVIATDFGVGLDEVSNTWRVFPEGSGFFKEVGQAAGGMLETRDIDSIRRYGDRQLMQTTPFFSAERKVEFIELVRLLTNRLQDFNILNEYYLNGQIEMRGMAAVKVGDRLWYQSSQALGAPPTLADIRYTGGIDFYVEAVTQEFQALTGWKTTVEVTRGQTHRERGTKLDWQHALPGNVPALANRVRPWGKS